MDYKIVSVKNPQKEVLHQSSNKHLKPFIKWVGGKGKLLDELIRRLPTNFENYFEPFVGGGALLWSVNSIPLENIVINDYNPELINLYKVVKKEPDKLIKALARHEINKEYYYDIRSKDREVSFKKQSPIFRASRFLYLNKTSFNGLYRVNSKGQHNVPYGQYPKPLLFNKENLMACSRFLKRIEILSDDFEIIKDKLDSSSFVYLDPPYIPISETSSFTSYTDKGFNIEMHKRLKIFCDFIDSIGAKFMLSNSSSILNYQLYQNFLIEEVSINRSISAMPSSRGKVKELIIRNYE